LHFPWLGKTRQSYLDQGIRDYAARLERYVPLRIEILRVSGGESEADEVLRRREGALLLEASRTASLRVALDPEGRELDSPALARLIADWEMQGQRTVSFLVGGHLGLDREVLHASALVLSLSRLTFTHEMSRLLLLEQLYRGWSIKAGHAYHK